MNDLAREAQKRIKKKRGNLVGETPQKRKPSKYISNLFTRTLLSIILVLISAIYININDANLIAFHNHFFKETLAFSKLNELYTKYFGSLLPDTKAKTTPVFENKEPFTQIEKIENSYKIALTGNTLQFLESGVVVFLGEKENLGKTLIVQGIDGIDIWYSNLSNCNVTMYDYVEKGAIVGEFSNNQAMLSFIENGEYISYENYLS